MKIREILSIEKPRQWEEIAAYKARVRSFMNDLPDVFIDQLLFRHYQHFKDHFDDKLDYEMLWELQNLSVDQLESLIGYGIEEDQLLSLGRFGSQEREKVLELKFKEGTWTAPIIVVLNHNNSWNSEGEYYLLDGHQRLGRMKTILRSNRATLNELHEVLILNLGY